jgi:hypothetical protein
MREIMVMSGSLMLFITFGSRIIMEGGIGILFQDGTGCRTIPGDGVFPISDGGTGDGVSVGTGFPQVSGVRLGFTGTMDTIISDGVRSAITDIPA